MEMGEPIFKQYETRKPGEILDGYVDDEFVEDPMLRLQLPSRHIFLGQKNCLNMLSDSFSVAAYVPWRSLMTTDMGL